METLSRYSLALSATFKVAGAPAPAPVKAAVPEMVEASTISRELSANSAVLATAEFAVTSVAVPSTLIPPVVPTVTGLAR